MDEEIEKQIAEEEASKHRAYNEKNLKIDDEVCNKKKHYNIIFHFTAVYPNVSPYQTIINFTKTPRHELKVKL